MEFLHQAETVFIGCHTGQNGRFIVKGEQVHVGIIVILPKDLTKVEDDIRASFQIRYGKTAVLAPDGNKGAFRFRT